MQHVYFVNENDGAINADRGGVVEYLDESEVAILLNEQEAAVSSLRAALAQRDERIAAIKAAVQALLDLDGPAYGDRGDVWDAIYAVRAAYEAAVKGDG